MSKIKVKGIKQLVDGTTQPISIGGVAEDNSDEVLNIAPNGDLQVKKVIQQENWITPTLLNSWVNFGGGYHVAEYMKDSLGFVHIRGLIKSGTSNAGTILFTLPVGYRPLARYIFPATTSSYAFGSLEVHETGNVIITLGNNTYMSLSAIIFKAEV